MEFGWSLGRGDLWFSIAGDDLRVSVVGASDSLLLEDWRTSSASGRLDEFHLSSGEVLVESRVQALVDAMAAWSRDNNAGAAPATAPTDAALTSALAAAWQTPADGTAGAGA